MTEVTLIDGTRAQSDSPAWRLECLARHVLAIAGRAERVEWLDDFEARHGKKPADELKDAMLGQHAAQREAA